MASNGNSRVDDEIRDLLRIPKAALRYQHHNGTRPDRHMRVAVAMSVPGRGNQHRAGGSGADSGPRGLRVGSPMSDVEG